MAQRQTTRSASVVPDFLWRCYFFLLAILRLVVKSESAWDQPMCPVAIRNRLQHFLPGVMNWKLCAIMKLCSSYFNDWTKSSGCHYFMKLGMWKFCHSCKNSWHHEALLRRNLFLQTNFASSTNRPHYKVGWWTQWPKMKVHAWGARQQA